MSQEQVETPDPKAGHDPEEVIARAETQRKTRALGFGLAIAAATVVFLGSIFFFSEELFRPELDVEAGEAKVIEATNDPQCRELITRVTVQAERYAQHSPAIEDEILGTDLDKIRAHRKTLQSIDEELVRSRELVEEAELRYPENTDDLNAFFDRTHAELTLLLRVSKAHADKLEASRSGKELVIDLRDKNKKKNEPKLTPAQKRDSVLLVVQDAFDAFRVWHSGDLQPCGAAADGEMAWNEEQDARQRKELREAFGVAQP